MHGSHDETVCTEGGFQSLNYRIRTEIYYLIVIIEDIINIFDRWEKAMNERKNQYESWRPEVDLLNNTMDLSLRAGSWESTVPSSDHHSFSQSPFLRVDLSFL